jgi:uncharacterized protein YyaL (SSP411 family)
MANRLAAEKSPYLLQHKNNPVDWFPWGEEAFAKARAEDKPVLLSIGYSTCHWCHVMERESFEDHEIARIMNERFVCIKLDREERPDVDKLYMTAVQAMTGQGGWPLNVFLTPELEPFYGGTYFPPKSQYGRPSWPALLLRVAELWKDKRGQLVEDARRMAGALKQYAAAESRAAAPQAAWLDAAFQALAAAYDPEFKGFGGAPKFPMPVNLDFLLRYHARTGSAEALRLVTETLKAMAGGGLFDQLGGGFSRYSTDERWRVPHFEKMLYDNAQLASVACDAYMLTRDKRLAEIARSTLDYALRDLRHPEGGFYSAEDADSAPEPGAPKREGAFYVWTREELERALAKDDFAAFCARYGVEPDGNALHDPHGELAGRNVLYEARGLDETAKIAGVPRAGLELRLARCRQTLLERRARRPRPHLDDKVLASWNGLMLGALARGARALEERAYLDAAGRAAAFLQAHLYDSGEKRLYRRWRDGQRAVPGTADDYAFLAQGLLDLYHAGGDPRWLSWALELTETQQALFAAPEGGLYMTAEGADANLLARVIEDSDNVEPCASSVAVSNLQRLSRLCQRDDFGAFARKTLERFGGAMEERPAALPAMLSALSSALMPPLEAVVCGDPLKDPARAMLSDARGRFLPHLSLLQLDEKTRPPLARLCPWTAALPVSVKPQAFVCVDYACGLPLDDSSAFSAKLDELRKR